MALKQWGNFPNKVHIFLQVAKERLISDVNFGPSPTKSSRSRSALSLQPTGCNYPWTVFSVAVSVTLPSWGSLAQPSEYISNSEQK